MNVSHSPAKHTSVAVNTILAKPRASGMFCIFSSLSLILLRNMFISISCFIADILFTGLILLPSEGKKPQPSPALPTTLQSQTALSTCENDSISTVGLVKNVYGFGRASLLVFQKGYLRAVTALWRLLKQFRTGKCKKFSEN